MKTDDTLTLSVKILDKEYGVSSPKGEEDLLVEAARMLDERMRMIRQSGKTIGIERIAVMAALNIASESVQLKRDKEQAQYTSDKQLEGLIDRVEKAVADAQQMEL